MKVGTLARRTGLSVRTLHHYDEIGLLSPARRTPAGHRLYGADDVARLQRIVSLRQLGLSLDEVGACLDDPAFTPSRVIEMQLARLREQIDLQNRLYRRLAALAEHFRAAEEVSVDDLIQSIEVTKMIEKYYTEAQLRALEERRRQLGEDGMQQAQQEWQDLYAQARAEMERGTDPTSEPVVRLARRALELIRAFTGGDAGTERSLNTMYRQEGPEAASRGTIDRAVWDYFGRAMDAARKEQ